MASLNQWTGIGNLGADAEIRQTNDGKTVATLNLACSESWTDKASGERKEKTEWIRIVVFGKPAEIIEKYTSKGSQIHVTGKFQTRKWTDKDGVVKYTSEIVVSGFGGGIILLGSKKDSPVPASDGFTGKTDAYVDNGIDDDDCPF